MAFSVLQSINKALTLTCVNLRIFNHEKIFTHLGEKVKAAGQLLSSVFALGSLLVFRMAHTLVSVCVFCLWSVNITEG